MTQSSLRNLFLCFLSSTCLQASSNLGEELSSINFIPKRLLRPAGESPHELYDKGNYYYFGQKRVEYPEQIKILWYLNSKDPSKRKYYGEGLIFKEVKEEDYQKAVKYYKKAQIYGHVGAIRNLGECYELGRGVHQNFQKAFESYKLAALQGDAEAQTNLGRMYLTGLGVTRDLAEAARWCRLATEQDYPSAQRILGGMYATGEGFTQDLEEAARWYHLAAEEGDNIAQWSLGGMYAEGHGVVKDEVEAVRWLHQAAEQGSLKLKYGLGCMYARGYPLTEDRAAAVDWWRKAAEQGYCKAQFLLDETVRWWSKASDQRSNKEKKEVVRVNFIGFYPKIYSKINYAFFNEFGPDYIGTCITGMDLKFMHYKNYRVQLLLCGEQERYDLIVLPYLRGDRPIILFFDATNEDNMNEGIEIFQRRKAILKKEDNLSSCIIFLGIGFGTFANLEKVKEVARETNIQHFICLRECTQPYHYDYIKKSLLAIFFRNKEKFQKIEEKYRGFFAPEDREFL